MDLCSASSVIRAAIARAELGYARRMAEQWLNIQPGHLAMSILLAEALLADGDHETASRILREVLQTDPESADALQLQAEIHEQQANLDLAWATAATLRQIRGTCGVAGNWRAWPPEHLAQAGYVHPSQLIMFGA
jgi:predicted Zn-dependent protease